MSNRNKDKFFHLAPQNKLHILKWRTSTQWSSHGKDLGVLVDRKYYSGCHWCPIWIPLLDCCASLPQMLWVSAANGLQLPLLKGIALGWTEDASHRRLFSPLSRLATWPPYPRWNQVCGTVHVSDIPYGMEPKLKSHSCLSFPSALPAPLTLFWEHLLNNPLIEEFPSQALLLENLT